LGPPEIVAPDLLIASSQRKGFLRNLAGAITMMVVPEKTGARTPPMSPMSWYAGSQKTAVALSRISKTSLIARVFSMRLA